MEVFTASDEQALRLIELPPELLQSLTSGTDQLVIKSPQNDPSAEAVVCSESKTWAMRQVQSSNTLMLLQAQSVLGSGQENSRHLSIAAHCNGTIETWELRDASSQIRSPTSYLLQLVPEYSTTMNRAGQSALSKRELMKQVPFSTAEVGASYEDLMAFETDSGAFRPTASHVVSMWTSLFQEAQRLSIDLTLPIDTKDLFEGTRLNEAYPLAAYAALLTRLSRSQEGPGNNAVLHENKVVSIIAKAFADSVDKGEAQDLEQRLQQVLPSAWHGQLRVIRESNQAASIAVAETQASRSVDSKRKPGARNWHEKFKKQKA